MTKHLLVNYKKIIDFSDCIDELTKICLTFGAAIAMSGVKDHTFWFLYCNELFFGADQDYQIFAKYTFVFRVKCDEMKWFRLFSMSVFVHPLWAGGQPYLYMVQHVADWVAPFPRSRHSLPPSLKFFHTPPSPSLPYVQES